MLTHVRTTAAPTVLQVHGPAQVAPGNHKAWAAPAVVRSLQAAGMARASSDNVHAKREAMESMLACVDEYAVPPLEYRSNRRLRAAKLRRGLGGKVALLLLTRLSRGLAEVHPSRLACSRLSTALRLRAQWHQKAGGGPQSEEHVGEHAVSLDGRQRWPRGRGRQQLAAARPQGPFLRGRRGVCRATSRATTTPPPTYRSLARYYSRSYTYCTHTHCTALGPPPIVVAQQS